MNFQLQVILISTIFYDSILITLTSKSNTNDSGATPVHNIQLNTSLLPSTKSMSPTTISPVPVLTTSISKISSTQTTTSLSLSTKNNSPVTTISQVPGLTTSISKISSTQTTTSLLLSTKNNSPVTTFSIVPTISKISSTYTSSKVTTVNPEIKSTSGSTVQTSGNTSNKNSIKSSQISTTAEFKTTSKIFTTSPLFIITTERTVFELIKSRDFIYIIVIILLIVTIVSLIIYICKKNKKRYRQSYFDEYNHLDNSLTINEEVNDISLIDLEKVV